jgi:hypothetical protein
VFESEPERLEGVVSENDTDWTAGMPKQDTTKRLLAKFQKIQTEASQADQSPKPQAQSKKVCSQ